MEGSICSRPSTPANILQYHSCCLDPSTPKNMHNALMKQGGNKKQLTEPTRNTVSKLINFAAQRLEFITYNCHRKNSNFLVKEITSLQYSRHADRWIKERFWLAVLTGFALATLHFTALQGEGKRCHYHKSAPIH